MPSKKYTTWEQIEDMRQELREAKLKKSESNKLKARRRWTKDRKGLIGVVGGILFGTVIVTLLFALVSINLAKSKGEIPNILGNYIFVVESGSMEPTLKVGTVILSRRPDDPSKLEKNDIVTFRTLSGSIVTHRIIDILDKGEGGIRYLTKGDNPINAIDQEELTPERVIGVFVARLPLP